MTRSVCIGIVIFADAFYLPLQFPKEVFEDPRILKVNYVLVKYPILPRHNDAL
jgi:hypothetical protein